MIVTDLTEKHRRDTEILHVKDNAVEISKTKEKQIDKALLDIKIALSDIIDTNKMICSEDKLDNVKSLSTLIDISSNKILDIIEQTSKE